jgi:hypothetical protein
VALPRLAETLLPTSTMTKRPLVLVAATTCVVGIAACGSSAKPHHSASYGQQVAFSKCIRAHQVPRFPDPGLSLTSPFSSIGGIEIPATINMQSPAFKAALTACAKLLPSGPRGPQASGQLIAKMRQTSQCMRQHGVSSFPDPTPTPPANPSGYSSVSGGNDAYLVIPNTINTQSPAFKQAAKACHFG